jgi:hypothetical protein
MRRSNRDDRVQWDVAAVWALGLCWVLFFWGLIIFVLVP